LVIAVGIALLLSSNTIRQSILPSFEGLNAGVEGFAAQGTFTRIDQTAPSPYRWISQDPKSGILQREQGYFIKDYGQVRVEVNNPQKAFEPFTQGRTVHYWVKEGPEKFIEVEGQINIYTLGLSVSAVNLPGLPVTFQGEQVWFALSAITWDSALQKQGADFGVAWEAPLAVVIEKWEVRDAGSHGKVDPSEQGRWITLYSSPQQIGTVSDLGLQVGGNVNNTFSGNTSPDSRLQKTAYFSITLTDFGVTSYIVSSIAPVVHYTLKIYSIQLGKYTYTNPDNTPFGVRDPESQNPIGDVLGGIGNWLNPFNLQGLGAYVILGAAGIVMVYFLRRRGV